jgi:hypothetical protein
MLECGEMLECGNVVLMKPGGNKSFVARLACLGVGRVAGACCATEGDLTSWESMDPGHVVV